MNAETESLAARLARHSAVGALWHTEGERVRCVACGHRCLLAPGRSGVCRVRFNERGRLRVPFGYVAGGLACDPVEKKPFFHLYPGSDALTFGMLGCDFHCAYCQNWVTSQALREAATGASIVEMSPRHIVEAALAHGARLVVSSYNEPLITAEWAVAVFRKANQAGLDCAFVSNGNATPEAIGFLQPWLTAYKVDLKTFDEARYRSLGGTLEHVKNTIRLLHERRIWLEIVTLVISGFNDSDAELRRIAAFIASVSRDIPWHVTAFHPDYRMTDRVATAARQLMRAAEIGREEGLHFVYAGNLPGRVDTCENTFCPSCGHLLVERAGFHVRQYLLTGEGACPQCQARIPGIWLGQTPLDGPATALHSASATTPLAP